MHIGPPIKPPQSLMHGRTEYRLYYLNDAGHFARAFEFRADTDEAACKIAEAWRDGRACELWCRERKVRGWDAS